MAPSVRLLLGCSCFGPRSSAPAVAYDDDSPDHSADAAPKAHLRSISLKQEALGADRLRQTRPAGHSAFDGGAVSSKGQGLCFPDPRSDSPGTSDTTTLTPSSSAPPMPGHASSSSTRSSNQIIPGLHYGGHASRAARSAVVLLPRPGDAAARAAAPLGASEHGEGEGQVIGRSEEGWPAQAESMSHSGPSVSVTPSMTTSEIGASQNTAGREGAQEPASSSISSTLTPAPGSTLPGLSAPQPAQQQQWAAQGGQPAPLVSAFAAASAGSFAARSVAGGQPARLSLRASESQSAVAPTRQGSGPAPGPAQQPLHRSLTAVLPFRRNASSSRSSHAQTEVGSGPASAHAHSPSVFDMSQALSAQLERARAAASGLPSSGFSSSAEGPAGAGAAGGVATGSRAGSTTSSILRPLRAGEGQAGGRGLSGSGSAFSVPLFGQGHGSRSTGASPVLAPAVSVGPAGAPSGSRQISRGSGGFFKRLLKASHSEPALEAQNAAAAQGLVSMGAGARAAWVARAHTTGQVQSYALGPGGGSLLGASVGRLACRLDDHAIAQQQQAAAAATTAAGTSSGSSSGAGAGARAQDEAAARSFADMFLKALLSGNAKWASNPALGALLHDQAVLIALDKQEFVGRTAIIRRLNQGMDQFLKMLGVTGEESEEAAAELAQRASKVDASYEVSVVPPGAKKGSGASAGASKASSSKTVVVITYTFKAGIRKFKMQDRFKVQGARILRLRRLRL